MVQKKKIKKIVSIKKLLVKTQPVKTPAVKAKIKSKKREREIEDEEDDIVGLPAMESDNDTETVDSDGSDDEVVEETEVVNSGSDSLESIEGSETFSLGGSADEGSKLEVIRSNPKPRVGWSDKGNTVFSAGDLVVPIELTKKEALEFEPWKVVCPDMIVETYTIKKSRVLTESIVYSDEIKLAPKNGKPFTSYWDATNPFKVTGVKISCPSNDRK